MCLFLGRINIIGTGIDYSTQEVYWKLGTEYLK